MESAAPSPRDEDGPPDFRARGGEFAAAVLGLFSTRLELFGLEAREERDRAITLLALVVVAAVAALLALMAVSGFVVVLFWDEHRLAALAGVAIVYILVVLWAVQRLKAGRGGAPAPFAATLAELERDAAWLRKRGER